MSVSGFEKNFGFGYMRLPQTEKGVYDMEEIIKMTDAFMEAGFNYFDTAHGYCDGQSEILLRKALVERYPRESFTITDKLSDGHFNSNEDIRPLFESQLKAVGVEYFDYYLMHAQGKGNFGKYKECKAYETAFELKKEGKIKHVGLSFHDSAEVLDEILTTYPRVEVVQIQFNYLDFDSPSTQSKACYDVCRKHGKDIIIMEPVKGGSLVNLPEKAKAVFDELKGGSYASYAIRFAAGFEGVKMVLSGMGNTQMVKDNTSYMKEFAPLNEEELEAVAKVSSILNGIDNIPCTACSYCTERCPAQINIPKIFALMNRNENFGENSKLTEYNNIIKKDGKASDCYKCGACERACPQHLEIRNLLEKAVKLFEKD